MPRRTGRRALTVEAPESENAQGFTVAINDPGSLLYRATALRIAELSYGVHLRVRELEAQEGHRWPVLTFFVIGREDLGQRVM